MRPRHDREPPMQSRIDAADKLRARKRAARSSRAKMFGAGICRPQLSQHHCGVDGQVSIPEQNETVNELAGPSQHLLPAASKTSSGKSLPRMASSKSAVVDSLM